MKAQEAATSIPASGAERNKDDSECGWKHDNYNDGDGDECRGRQNCDNNDRSDSFKDQLYRRRASLLLSYLTFTLLDFSHSLLISPTAHTPYQCSAASSSSTRTTSSTSNNHNNKSHNSSKGCDGLSPRPPPAFPACHPLASWRIPPW